MPDMKTISDKYICCCSENLYHCEEIEKFNLHYDKTKVQDDVVFKLPKHEGKPEF